MYQDNIFLDYEGDNWFNRNSECLGGASKHDPILNMIRLYNIIPHDVLEIGASNGWRLHEINETYGSKCTAVEPSELAVRNGKKRYPKVEFYRNVASDLPFDEGQKFDLIIMNFVFHWISRERLFKSVYEIDRVLNDGGFLIIGDFLPNNPSKVNYHHIKDRQVWTYKQDYACIFESSGIYKKISFFTGNHETKELDANVDSNNRIVISLLQKKVDDYERVELHPTLKK